jgi:uncharacterized membrane protein
MSASIIQSQKLSQAKLLGGIGSLLMLLVIVPYAGSVLFIVGLVLVLIALKYISDEVNEPKIFNNALYGVILLVLSYVILFVAILTVFMAGFIGTIFSISGSIIPGVPSGGQGYVSYVTTITVTPRTEIIRYTVASITRAFPPPGLAYFFTPHEFIRWLLAIIVPLIIVLILLVIASIFIKRSFDTVANRLGVGLFTVVGILYLIGSILTIVLVGLLLIYIAIIIQTIAFFSIPERLETSPQQVIKA